MKLRHILTAAAITACFGMGAQSINPITQAMLDGYTQAIAENPKDYFSYYERGAQLYQLSRYDSAKSDILKAIEHTPAKDADMLSQEYSLLSNICVQTKQYDEALAAIQSAIDLKPDTYQFLYDKGNILLYLNRPEEAYGTFSSMQRFKSRSQEAYFGMAKAAIMMGKDDEAAQLIEQAEAADPTNYLTYCRIGDLYSDLDQNENAAANYLSAFALADDTSRPLAALGRLSREDYPALKRAIDYAVSKSNNPLMMHLLRSTLAFQSGNYKDAYFSVNKMLEQPEGQQPGIYALKARTAMAMNKLPEASEAIEMAIRQSPQGEYYVIKAQVERANSNPAAALAAATRAVKANPDDPDALLEAALANMDLGDYDAAITELNEVVMSNADMRLPLMLRAYANSVGKKNEKAAVSDYSRAAAGDDDDLENATYKALAQSLGGKKLDGDATMERVLAANPDKNGCYYGALYYAQTGNLERAQELLSRALQLGYENEYNLRTNNTANLNLSPLRHLTNP